MGFSEPKYPLTDHCSVVHDGTLYVYSPAGFQALDLQKGAEWKALPMDVSLTGAQCVMAQDGNDPKLYIVGGRVNETITNWGYPGLMHYTFATKKWDWQRSKTWNTQDRQSHAASYLESSKKLLIYAGSQDAGNLKPSTQTFLMSTVAPYDVQSMPSVGAPPSVKPMLMAMDNDSVLLVGGGPTNKALWKFSEAKGWQDLGVSLQEPIVNPEAVQCTVVAGKGKSMVLEKFDLSVTPNKVDRILLLKEDGSPAAPGATVGGKTKRVTVDEWPTYNATYAPTSPRSGYSIAQGNDGMTVASGGNQADPIAMFDAKENSWLNATAVFKGQQMIMNSELSSTTSLASATATAAASPSASSTEPALPPAAPSNKGKMLTVLGATLGTIFGIAALLILILVCLKYRKSKSRQKEGYIEKDRMSFADRGADFMKEAGGSVVAPQYHQNNDSYSSLAIIQQGRGPANHKKNTASDASAAGLIKKTSPLGYYSEPVELSKFDLKPESVNEKVVRQNSGRVPATSKNNPRSRSSGWSRYFANNEATNLANVQPDRSTYVSDRTSTGSQSQYTNTNSHFYSQRPSQHVAPLEIPKFDGQRLSRVASGSPTLGSSIVTLPHQVQPMQAELDRANSNASSRSGVSALGHDDYYHKPVESWTPVHDNNRTSSTYTGSMVFDSNYNRNDASSSYYGTDSYYPKSNFNSLYQDSSKIPDSSTYPAPPRLGQGEDRSSTVTVFPGPNAPQAGTSTQTKDHLGSFFPPTRVGHESNVTMFPGPGGDRAKDGQSDMSWLNLGGGR